VQVAALSHELQHMLNQHDAPCGLHVVADHLVMVPAPEPEPAVALAPTSDQLTPSLGTPRSVPSRLADARAPPRPV
jgi:hypothetical protein